MSNEKLLQLKHRNNIKNILKAKIKIKMLEMHPTPQYRCVAYFYKKNGHRKQLKFNLNVGLMRKAHNEIDNEKSYKSIIIEQKYTNYK